MGVAIVETDDCDEDIFAGSHRQPRKSVFGMLADEGAEQPAPAGRQLRNHFRPETLGESGFHAVAQMMNRNLNNAV